MGSKRIKHDLATEQQQCHPYESKNTKKHYTLSFTYVGTISSLVPTFSSCHQCFPGSGSFPMSQHFTSSGLSFGASASASNKYSGLISFRIDWFDLLAVQGTLQSLLQHCSSNASILWCSAFFLVQLSHLCMITGKTIVLTIWTFVRKVMSLLFNLGFSRFVIIFLPRSKHLLISWL